MTRNCYLFYKNLSGSNTIALSKNVARARKHFETIYRVPESKYRLIEQNISNKDVCIFTHGPPKRNLKKRGLWINTWHGFPMKNMGFLFIRLDLVMKQMMQHLRVLQHVVVGNLRLAQTSRNFRNFIRTLHLVS
mgnify:CR=1 FL=1